MIDSRFKKALVAVGGAALLTASAVPAVAQDDGPLFVAINKSADQVYFIDLQRGFTEKIEELGGRALTFDAKLDPSLGVSLVNDAISAGAVGIATTVPEQTIGPAVVDVTSQADVALVATDDNITDADGNAVPFVGFDGIEMGTKMGESAAELLTAADWLADPALKVGVLSTEVQTLSVCEDRTNTAKQLVLDAGVPAENIYQVPYSGETVSAQDAAGPVITAHPDVTNWVVFACNDEGALGTINALATAGVDSDTVIGVGLGAYEACKPWAAGQASGFKSALFLPGYEVGQTAAQALWDNVVNGEPLPPFSASSTAIVTPDTYTEYTDCGV